MDCLASKFNALPNELFSLIASYTTTISSLLSLTRVSKRSYDAFNPILYRKIDSLALTTVASTENARLPLSGPHPATFVRCMTFAYPFDCDDPTYLTPNDTYRTNEEAKKRLNALAPPNLITFQKLVEAAVSNIVFYAPHAAIETFEYRCQLLSLPDAFRNINFAAFSSLKNLNLGCPFPSKNLRKSVAMIKSLCGPSLTHFGLSLQESDPLNPATGAKVFRYLQESSPNITWLGLIVPKAWETTKTVTAKPLHQLLVDPTFNFPHLTHLSIIDAGMNYIGYEAFFLRHSNIKVLSYWGIPLNSSGLSNPEMLPTLSQLVATVDDCISLCSSGMRPIDSLLLSVAVDITPETAILLKEAFMCTKSMRQLAIFDLRGDGINLDNLRIITAACPQLTHFDLPLNAEASKVSALPTVYNTIASNLPELKHLKLSAPVDSRLGTSSVGSLKNDHLRALEHAMHPDQHQALDTAEVEFFTTVDSEPDYMGRLDIVKERPGGTWVVVQNPDRLGFNTDVMVSTMLNWI